MKQDKQEPKKQREHTPARLVSQGKLAVHSPKLGKEILVDLEPKLPEQELLNMSMGYSNSAGGSG